MSGGFSVTVDTKDLDELRKTIKVVGDVPQRCVTSAAGKGANLTKKTIRGSGQVPVDTGALKSGIIRTRKERSKSKGKAVYRIDFDARYNDIFQKKVLNPGAAGSTQTSNGHAYYPYSMEFGYIARNGRYIPGFHFMRDGAEDSRSAAEGVMLKALNDNLTKEWKKEHGH